MNNTTKALPAFTCSICDKTKKEFYKLAIKYKKLMKPEKALSGCNKKELFIYIKKADKLLQSMYAIDRADDERTAEIESEEEESEEESEEEETPLPEEDMRDFKMLTDRFLNFSKSELIEKFKNMIIIYKVSPGPVELSTYTKHNLAQILAYNTIEIAKKLKSRAPKIEPKIEPKREGVKVTTLSNGTKMLSVNFMELVRDKENAKARLRDAVKEFKTQ